MFFETLTHVLPPSLVRLTWPSLLPVQMTPFCLGDGAIAISASPYSGPMLSPVNPPDEPCLLLSLRVRSGLMICQLWPASLVSCTNWLPAHTLLWSNGSMASGKVQ